MLSATSGSLRRAWLDFDGGGSGVLQQMGGTAAMIDAEHAFDADYALNLGVDVDNLLVCQPESGEMALEGARCGPNVTHAPDSALPPGGTRVSGRASALLGVPGSAWHSAGCRPRQPHLLLTCSLAADNSAPWVIAPPRS